MRIVSADLSYVCHSALGEAIRDADVPYSVIPPAELITELSGKLGEDFYEKNGCFYRKGCKNRRKRGHSCADGYRCAYRRFCKKSGAVP